MKETAYLLQAALVSAWWVGLAASDTFFAAFQFPGIPAPAFWSFFAPDVVLIAVLSTIRAYRRLVSIEFIILGAFGYAALYCVNAAVLTAAGLLPTGLMLLGLAYNVFLCFSTHFFRPARSRRLLTNAVKTLFQIVCIWFLALVAIPYVLMDSFGSTPTLGQGVSFWMGCGLFVGFSLLGLWSSCVIARDGRGTPLPLDQTNTLVVSGPYRFVRNPMAIAGIGQGLAVSLAFLSPPVLIYSLLGVVVWHFVVRPFEERDLAGRFGDSYLAYRSRVRCWVPRFRRIAA